MENKAKENIVKAFPNLDLHDKDCHGGIERELAQHIKEFTEEQWRAVLSHDNDYAFQDGISHISWNTDRRAICHAICKEFEKLNSWEYNDTWYTVKMSEYKAPNGMLFRLKLDEPLSFSHGNYHWHIEIINKEDLKPVCTHTAVLLGITDNGRVYINDQHTGTLNDCEKFIEENISRGLSFKIMERK